MPYFWLDFIGHSPGTLMAEGAKQAMEKASDIGTVKQLRTLPYPAQPFLEEIEHPDFCYSPTQCAGRSACPKSPACSS